MLKQLLNILRSEHLDQSVAADLRSMLGLSEAAVRQASAVLFGSTLSSPEQSAFYGRDQRINHLQQGVRKALVSQLPFSSTMQQARLLVLNGLIKDVERIGDEAKNLLEAAEMLPGPLPDDELTAELQAIRNSIDGTLGEVCAVLEASDRERARRLCSDGAQISKRCDRLLHAVRDSQHPASLAVPIALAARHYKRIQKHLMNLLSSVLMPLHKIDYFDAPE